MVNDEPPVLQINNLEFHYDQPLIRIEAFKVHGCESVGVIGPSGCGKTTLIHLIAGLLRPLKGSVQINGIDLSQLNERAIDRIRGRSLGIVFQRLHLLPSISVIDNLLLAQRLAGVPLDRTFAIDLIEQLSLGDALNKKPAQLSQGQAQRVAIARSLAHRPSLVVADEPTSALDDANADAAMTMLQSLTEATEAALIVVTHDERVRARVGRTFNLGDES